MNWEDRLTTAQKSEIVAVTMAFRRKGNVSQNDQHILYDLLTGHGMTPEEADEWINLELENMK